MCIHDYDHGKYEQLCQLLACYPQVGGSMYERGKEEGERQVENEIKHSPVILHCVCVTVAVHVHEKKVISMGNNLYVHATLCDKKEAAG